jgi:uncharacterized protein (DUF1697 family)
MGAYVALLRGVNVGGNTIRMNRLREICSKLGFKNARTYLQSGNIAFQASGSASTCARAIERALANETRLGVFVMVRTRAELGRTITANPFLEQPGIDRSKLHVTFLGERVSATAMKKLSEVAGGADQFCCAKQEIYLHCPNGYGKSKFSNNHLERILSVRATTRNWNTVTMLYEMAGGPATD